MDKREQRKSPRIINQIKKSPITKKPKIKSKILHYKNYQYRNYLQDVYVKTEIADDDIDIRSKSRTRLDQFDFSQSDFRDMMLTEILAENVEFAMAMVKRSIKVFKDKHEYFRNPYNERSYEQKKERIATLINCKSQQESMRLKEKMVTFF